MATRIRLDVSTVIFTLITLFTQVSLYYTSSPTTSFLAPLNHHEDSQQIALTMAETTALVVGLVMPALHIIRLLAEDIKKIIDAPKIIQDLRDKLDAIHASLGCLKDITEAQWAALGQKVSDQSKATIEACIKTCRDLDGRIHNWTKTQNGQLSWRRKAVIGLFKEHRIKAEADQLLACKASLDATVNMATL